MTRTLKTKVIDHPALSPVEIEAALKRVVAHLLPYQREAFTTMAAAMIHRFETNRWRAKMKLTYSDIIVAALGNFASAAAEAKNGNMARALASAADAANLLALRLTSDEDEKPIEGAP